MINTDRFVYAPDLYSLHDTDNIYCSCCGDVIEPLSEYYEVGGECYCMGCEAHAEDAILEAVRDSYIVANE
ncbi:MAG: hypothetical protein ACI4DP_00130 [Candidatus Ornithomonoglobus sp.]